jgi:hypothetical protein
MVPAELLLGPNGKPLLGVDNRPLIVAIDEEGVPLVCSSEGSVLLGPDDLPLVLATASDGSLVALDSQCRPLTGEERDGVGKKLSAYKNFKGVVLLPCPHSCAAYFGNFVAAVSALRQTCSALGP